jgi:hypothetical protein
VDGCPRRQVEFFADGTIKQILQVMLPGLASSGPHFGNFVAVGIAPLKRVVRRVACSGVGLSWM